MSASPIDWEQLDMISDGFSPDFMEIYDEFVAEIPGLLADLRQQVSTGNAAQAARVAHQIKGSSANFGFVGVSQPTAALEYEAKAGSLAQAATHIADAERGYREALAAVKVRRGR